MLLKNKIHRQVRNVVEENRLNMEDRRERLVLFANYNSAVSFRTSKPFVRHASYAMVCDCFFTFVSLLSLLKYKMVLH